MLIRTAGISRAEHEHFKSEITEARRRVVQVIDEMTKIDAPARYVIKLNLIRYKLSEWLQM